MLQYYYSPHLRHYYSTISWSLKLLIHFPNIELQKSTKRRQRDTKYCSQSHNLTLSVTVHNQIDLFVLFLQHPRKIYSSRLEKSNQTPSQSWMQPFFNNKLMNALKSWERQECIKQNKLQLVLFIQSYSNRKSTLCSTSMFQKSS